MLNTDRRGFIKSTAALAAAGVVGNAFAGGSDEIRVAVVGCGDRGSGAAENVLTAAKGVKIVALADVFKPKAYALRERLANFLKTDSPAKEYGNTADVDDDHCFDGLNAYEQVMATDANYVMLCTPPGFRPLHLEAAVKAGKHIFTEKPVGVDGPGLRRVFALLDEVKEKGLHVAAGTQRRHQAGYIRAMAQVHGGTIGDITSMRCYWNGQGIWFRKRQPEMNDLTYQLTNWYHFLWICGDHIVEQHVHNIDVCNWAARAHPVRCDGIGGRAGHHSGRPEGPPEEVGNIFDHFSIDYVYDLGGREVHMYSSCRHVPNTHNNVSEAIVGTKGNVFTADPGQYRVNGKAVAMNPAERERDKMKYVQEHADLIIAMRGGDPLNELRNVAESTLAAIMGRMSAYTGGRVTWKQALDSQEDTFPADLGWDAKIPVPPVPVPGKTKLA